MSPRHTHTHHLGSAGQMWNLVDFLKKDQTHLLIVTFKSQQLFSFGVGGDEDVGWVVSEIRSGSD